MPLDMNPPNSLLALGIPVVDDDTGVWTSALGPACPIEPTTLTPSWYCIRSSGRCWFSSCGGGCPRRCRCGCIRGNETKPFKVFLWENIDRVADALSQEGLELISKHVLSVGTLGEIGHGRLRSSRVAKYARPLLDRLIVVLYIEYRVSCSVVYLHLWS